MPDRPRHLATAAVVASAGLMLCVSQSVMLPTSGNVLESQLRPTARQNADEQRESVEQLVQSLEEALQRLAEFQQKRTSSPDSMPFANRFDLASLLGHNLPRWSHRDTVAPPITRPLAHLNNLPPPGC